MRHLFDCWTEFAEQAEKSKHILLLADYDGTLTPIVSRPELAVLPESAAKKLRALGKKQSISVGIVSGRSLSEVRRMVGVSGIYYAGNHGLEIEGPGVRYVSEEAEKARAVLNEMASSLNRELATISGVIVENKGLSLSVHYRQVPESKQQRAEEVFRRIAEPLRKQGKIRLTSGKKVWEVRPPIDWDKGKAVLSLESELKKLVGLDGMMTLYMGDDTTDEDAFGVIKGQGWGIYVGGENPGSQAEYYLNSEKEVESLLSRMHRLKINRQG